MFFDACCRAPLQHGTVSVTHQQKWDFVYTTYFFSKTPGTCLYTILVVVVKVAKQQLFIWWSYFRFMISGSSRHRCTAYTTIVLLWLLNPSQFGWAFPCSKLTIFKSLLFQTSTVGLSSWHTILDGDVLPPSQPSSHINVTSWKSRLLCYIQTPTNGEPSTR